MKRRVAITIFAALMLVSVPLAAQERQQKLPAGAGQWRNYRQCLIDWKESPGGSSRYTVAIRPFYLINFGLKLDFEFELNHAGQWLQFEIAGRNSGWNRNNELWEMPEAANAGFNKVDGFGVGVAYKNFFTSNGWYFSAGVVFNYYNVHHMGGTFVSFTEDGALYQRYESTMLATKYYKPGFNLNVGKHMALTKNLFLDAYIGLGYARSYTEGVDIFNQYNPFSMAYSGVICSAGFRIGWAWGSGK